MHIVVGRSSRRWQIFKAHITHQSIKRQLYKLQCTCWYMTAGRPISTGRTDSLNSMQVLVLKVTTSYVPDKTSVLKFMIPNQFIIIIYFIINLMVLI
jgi:hypothetical protein